MKTLHIQIPAVLALAALAAGCATASPAPQTAANGACDAYRQSNRPQWQASAQVGDTAAHQWRPDATRRDANDRELGSSQTVATNFRPGVQVTGSGSELAVSCAGPERTVY